jgi:Cu(I)/Ag(I) efflux system membrane protein CusA/SilA
MGKLGRAETALDPAPLGMIETVVLLKPYREWPAHDLLQNDGRTVQRPAHPAEVRALLAAESDIPGVAPQLAPTHRNPGGHAVHRHPQSAGPADTRRRFRRPGTFCGNRRKNHPGHAGRGDAQMQREGGKPYAEIRLDPARLARFGLSQEQVMQAVETALGGMALTYSVEGTLRYPVRIRYLRERRDDTDELPLVQVPVAEGHGAIPLAQLLAAPTVYTLDFTGSSTDAHTLPGQLTLNDQRNFTVLDHRHAELTVAAGDPAPLVAQPFVRAQRPSEAGLTYTIGPMAIRSEGGKRTQYVMLNTQGGEVDVVRAADARLQAALAEGRLELPEGATYRWVGRYEQKLKADAILRVVIAASMALMVVLIYLGTRSWLITGIIILCNALVTTAGGFFFVWWWDAEMTTAVVVGFLVLLGVMFNDGILLGTYIQEQFKIPPTTVEDVHRRVFHQAGLRRRRPAIMTNATTMLSLVPVLWATGRGSELMQPMVLPVVGGMIFDVVSLFSVPVFFTWYWERKLARQQSRAGV